MPDIFLSYSRDDQATARLFAEGFEREGFKVWWDATLHSGEAYDQVTEKALREAKAVVVLWSKKSVDSRWVRAEATTADRNKTLVPVMIEPCLRPIMFELTHTADLSHWKGDASDKVWRTYVADVHRFVQRGEPAQVAIAAASVHSGAGRGQGFSRTSLGVLVAVVIIVGGIVWAVTRTSGKTAPQAAQTAQAGGSRASAKAVSAPAGVSLAVLPFVDMSPEHNQDYFSDGLSEELLNQLAQIKELRVTGRTSSFSFKGKNEDLRVIGEKLGVGNILEGSVRKEGNHLRITAQLINAKDGTYLWSQTFDRELTGVFAIQEEIAMAVSGALSITLDVGAMSREKGGTTNVEAYDKYLRARKLSLQGGPKATVQAAQSFREALALDPNFGLAWLGLYDALRYTLIIVPETQAAARREMEEVSAHITKIAPNAWWAQATRAYQFADLHKWSEAAAALNAAMASAPASANLCGDFFGAFGRAKEAVACAERQREADPLSLAASGSLQLSLDMVGRFAEAQAEYERSKDFAGGHAVWDFHAMRRLWSSKGANPAAVEAQFRYFLKHEDLPMPLNHIMVDRLGDKAAALTAIRQAFADPANQDGSRMNTIARYADHYGDLDLTLAAVRRSFVDLHFTNLGWLWSYYETNLRSDPRFKDLLRDLGLVDYFRASGNWGDFCKPVGKDDFECH
ncbi:MAG TPA: TIR domain-containing protein [Steroidobacteraceae bacterium]|nr:TIR domain-containing protein [Steroidobacteraceae bacterium]